MQYVVLKIGGKQYKVTEGEEFIVDKLSIQDNNQVTFEDVLLYVNEGKVTMGNPNIKGAKVQASILENKKGDKIQVRRFKAKSRYRRVNGFRPQLTVLKIDKISVGENKVEKTEKEEK